MRSFGHKMHSFGHNLDRALNQKNSLTKVVHLYIVNKEMLSKDRKLHSLRNKTHSFRHNLNGTYIQRIFKVFQGFSWFFNVFQGFSRFFNGF